MSPRQLLIPSGTPSPALQISTSSFARHEVPTVRPSGGARCLRSPLVSKRVLYGARPVPAAAHLSFSSSCSLQAQDASLGLSIARSLLERKRVLCFESQLRPRPYLAPPDRNLLRFSWLVRQQFFPLLRPASRMSSMKPSAIQARMLLTTTWIEDPATLWSSTAVVVVPQLEPVRRTHLFFLPPLGRYLALEVSKSAFASHLGGNLWPSRGQPSTPSKLSLALALVPVVWLPLQQQTTQLMSDSQ
mmetsp:Transcript_29723/g.63181  ORF Transcript_29723/g.63181 Transcript_29723/m.63181 type:complete len:245 (-) Transcript_29723:102-836(-)